MSNVIPFPERPKSKASEEVVYVQTLDGMFCSTLLLEGLDNPRKALNRAEGIVSRMPHGPSRVQAEQELMRLRSVLGVS